MNPNAASKTIGGPYLWRVLLSLFAWSLVAIMTILLYLFALIFVTPLSALIDRGSRRMIHSVSRCWGRLLLTLMPIWSIRVEGAENIDPKQHYVVVANHQSLVDILALLAALNIHFKFMAKQELFAIPFMGWHMSLAKYIPVLRGQKDSALVALEKVRGLLQHKISVVFFPEGTRSTDGQIQTFKSGAFKMAVQEKVPILPVIIEGTGTAVPKHSFVVTTVSRFLVRIGKPVDPSECGDGSYDQVKNIIREKMIQELDAVRAS